MSLTDPTPGSHAASFDAHGHKDHGHVIVSIWTLRAVLTILLFFTFATVGAAWAEQWIGATFNIVIPQWINVFVALSIAVVKTTLVVMFFMQLRYDNPLNTMIFIFTMITVAFFLGFTALDLGNRQTIDRFKMNSIYDGGRIISGGGFIATPDAKLVERAELDAATKAANPYVYVNVKGDESMVERARRLAAERKQLNIAEEGHGEHHAHHGHNDQHGDITQAGYRRDVPALGSSSNLSRPITGVTLPGFADPDAAKPGATPTAPATSGGH